MSNPLYIYHMYTRLIGSRGLVKMSRAFEKQFYNRASVIGSLSGWLYKVICFLCLFLCSSWLFANEDVINFKGGRLFYKPAYNQNNIIITRCFDCPSVLILPKEINGKIVTEIGDSAFSDKGLTAVSIPNTVTIIGSSAFARNQLTSMKIPENVTTIWQNAFASNQLTSLTFLGDSLTAIHSSAFGENFLTNVTIPNSVTDIGSFAFQRNRLWSLDLGSSVKNIGWCAFCYNSLSSVTIPESVTYLDSYAFGFNKFYRVTFLGDRPQMHITSPFGFNAQHLQPSFHYCNDRAGWPGDDIDIGNGWYITPISKLCADSDNDGVGDNADAFPLDSNETLDTDSDGVGNNADTDDDGDGIEDVSDPLPLDYFNGFTAELNGESFTLTGCSTSCPEDLVIPNTIGGIKVASIESYAFNANYLTSVTILDSITNIGNYAFANNQLTSVTLPDSLVTIGNEAFKGNQLISVILPSRLVSLGQGAFRNNNLKNITIPSTVVSIGNGAFKDNQLANITIPRNLVSIGNNAFNNNNLASATFFGQRPTLNIENSFLGNSDLAIVSYCAGMIGWPGEAIKKSLGQYITPEVTTVNNDNDCDGFDNANDAFPDDPFESIDTDTDGVGNNADTDDDGDGIFDSLDTYPLDPTNQPIQQLDIDGNGQADALTDSLLITRYMFGFRGEALIDGAVGEGATRTTSAEIEAYLEALIP